MLAFQAQICIVLTNSTQKKAAIKAAFLLSQIVVSGKNR